MKQVFTFLTVIFFISIAHNGWAQKHPQPEHRLDSLKRARALSPQEQKQKMEAFYRKSLKVDSLKAQQINQIMSAYKASMQKVTDDKSLSADARKVKVKALIEEKNRKLVSLLSPEQQAKIIPLTERDPSRGARK